MPEVKTVLENQGMEAPSMSPKEVGDYIRADVKKFAPILKNPKLKQG